MKKQKKQQVPLEDDCSRKHLDETHLLFRLRKNIYGVPTEIVRELVHLPELILLDEVPDFVVGALDFRNTIIPVIDLSRYFGHPSQRYALDDHVIVLSDGHKLIGILVNEALNVHQIDPSRVSPALEFEGAEERENQIISGLAEIETGIAMLLDPAQMMNMHFEGHMLDTTEHALPRVGGSESTVDTIFFPDANEAERKALLQRARALKEEISETDNSQKTHLAIIDLNGEYLGIDMNHVREFAEIDTITPVPCTPSHILGNINLRGEVMTLVDIRPALGISLSKSLRGGIIVVIGLKDLVIGIGIHDVLDVLYRGDTELAPLSSALKTKSGDFLKGAIPYLDNTVCVVDLQALLQRGELIVNETP